ncbi:hypothetical protein predicted by Glimmer/Critica [Lactiplantibacillus plantarum]|nr:hypothetical protein predicted by Glimmer/Critica [Lactiplantibacillus plantarum]
MRLIFYSSDFAFAFNRCTNLAINGRDRFDFNNATMS